MARIAAIIPAAGQGKRMGQGINKQLMLLNGKPVLAHTLDCFQRCPLIDEIVVVASADEMSLVQEQVITAYAFDKVSRVVIGGQERQDSVRAGLAAVNPDTEWVVVHDGARPLLLLPQLEKIVNEALAKGSGVAAVPVKDTIKQVTLQGQVIATLPRESLWAAQTPQVFRLAQLRRAHFAAYEAGFRGTDDASLVERLGESVHVVKGSYENIKLTTPEDLVIAENILKRRESRCE